MVNMRANDRIKLSKDWKQNISKSTKPKPKKDYSAKNSTRQKKGYSAKNSTKEKNATRTSGMLPKKHFLSNWKYQIFVTWSMLPHSKCDWHVASTYQKHLFTCSILQHLVPIQKKIITNNIIISSYVLKNAQIDKMHIKQDKNMMKKISPSVLVDL